MLRLLLTATLALTACLEVHAAQDGLLLTPFPDHAGPKLTYERLTNLLQTKNLTSIEQVLGALPQSVRDNTVLLYRSRSLQRAQFMAPRALLAESDGSFVMGINDAQHVGGNVIETIQFRPETSRWELREITLAPGQAPSFSEANPKKCLECHQSVTRSGVDPRPNWEPYSNWPGAYGASDGNASEVLAKDPFARLLPEDKEMLEEQKDEEARLREFLTGVKPTHPRYKFLGNNPAPNTVILTDTFVTLNAYRVARLMTETEDWDVYRDFMLESLFCTENESAGDDLDPNLHKTIPPEIAAALNARARAYPADLEKRKPFVSKFDRSFGFYAWLFFDLRGIDTLDWSMSFKAGGRFAFRDRFGSPSEPEEQLRSAIRKLKSSQQLCNDTRAHARVTAPQLRASGRYKQILAKLTLPLAAPDPQALTAKCASCHSGEARIAPLIPFNDSAKLREALRQTGFQHGTLLDEIEHRTAEFARGEEQMPPTGHTDPRLREAFLKYLRQL